MQRSQLTLILGVEFKWWFVFVLAVVGIYAPVSATADVRGVCERQQTAMGALNCCGGGQSKRRRGGRSRMVHSATTEPLLRESEREAVSSLLKYLEEGIGV